MEKRKINLFEVVLLIAGLELSIVGFFLINAQYQAVGHMSWDMLQTVFLWLALIILLVLSAIMIDVKEELKVVMKEQGSEVKLLRETVTRHRR